MKEAVRKRRKAFAAAHKSDEDLHLWFPTCPPVIAKAQAEAWQANRFSLAPKSDPNFCVFSPSLRR